MKKRDREYTPEEAFAITMGEVTRHWYRSVPLVIGIDAAENPYPQPLHAAIQSGIWVFFFGSATSPIFSDLLEIFRAWAKRYQSLDVQFVLAFQGEYPYFFNRKTVEAWLTDASIATPAVCDVEGSLARSFGVGGEPGIAVLHDGRIAISATGPEWMVDTEARLQALLRGSSPGLPLWPVLPPPHRKVLPGKKWQLRAGSAELTSATLQLTGAWSVEEDRIVTSDPSAELCFLSAGSEVSIVAQSLSESGDPTRIRFDTNGASFSDTFGGHDFSVDDEGNSGVLLAGPRAYSILRGLPPTLRKLRFRFPFAKVSAVAIYGLEFAEAQDLG